jgi:hypothetical protein
VIHIEGFPNWGEDFGGRPHIFVRMALSPSLLSTIFIVEIPVGHFDISLRNEPRIAKMMLST